jgi:hypothetical protein
MGTGLIFARAIGEMGGGWSNPDATQVITNLVHAIVGEKRGTIRAEMLARVFT